MWLPPIVKGPPPLVVPVELEPSPQSIVAVKSERVPIGLASTRLATRPLYDCGELPAVAQLAVSAASAMVAESATVAAFEAAPATAIFTLIV